MPKSTYLDNAMVNAVLRASTFTSPTSVYVALFNGNPSSGGIEASGGSYLRQQITFTVPANGVTSNSASVSFTGMPATTISYIAICDAATAGNVLYYAAVAVTKNTNTGDTVSIAAGGISITES